MIGDAALANPPSSNNDTVPLLKKFLTFGSGPGKDEKGTYTAIVLYHESAGNALANVSLLKQRIETSSSILYNTPWKEKITGTDIRAEGHMLLAKLYTSRLFWATWIYAQDNLFRHEE